MGLTDIIHKSIGEFIDYEKHSVFYATLSTAVGVIGGVAGGIYAATAYGTGVVGTALASIGSYIGARGIVGVTTHLKNIYNLAIGKYAKKETKSVPANLTPAPAT